ncbi:MAG: hypothetical protein U5L96_07680 [Owenweeksia sp.]|nr:hypothetical protein [Owenweeksia sp.]
MGQASKPADYPINSAGEEFSLIVAPDGKTGYFSSNNLAGGMGMLDLYSLSYQKKVRQLKLLTSAVKLSIKKRKKPVSASIEFSDLVQGKTVLEEQSGRDGRYFSVLPGNSDYALSIQKPGFLFTLKTLA